MATCSAVSERVCQSVHDVYGTKTEYQFNNNNSSAKLKYRPIIHTYPFEVFCSPVFPLSGASVSPLFGFIFHRVRRGAEVYVMQVSGMRRRLQYKRGIDHH